MSGPTPSASLRGMSTSPLPSSSSSLPPSSPRSSPAPAVPTSSFTFSHPGSGSSSPNPRTLTAVPRIPTKSERRSQGRKKNVEYTPDPSIARGARQGISRSVEVGENGVATGVETTWFDAVRPAQRRRVSDSGLGVPTAYEWPAGDVDGTEGAPTPLQGWEDFDNAPEDALGPDGDWDQDDGIMQDVHGRRKFYASSDDPMAVWRPLITDVLDATFDLDDLLPDTVCGCCSVERGKRQQEASAMRARILEEIQAAMPGVALPLLEALPKEDDLPTARDSGHRLYRCDSCGTFVECKACCLRRHAQSPLHVIRVWVDGAWQRTSLFEMGLELQLFHHGLVCPRQGGYTTLTVLHTNGVHRVRVGWCSCHRAQGAPQWRQCMKIGWYPSSWSTPETVATVRCLRRFRLLNVIGNINIRDFVTTLERMTDPLAVAWLPDRYKNFGYMVRQFLFLMRLRRAGTPYLPRSIAEAPLGSVAVKCWACPRPGFNLPAGWENVQENIRFKYNLFLGLDANFRLENKLRRTSKDKDYTALGDGLGVFAPLYGADGYNEHLKKYVSEQDVTQCASFAALMQRDTRFSRGLRATGVGACSCTRHECVRPMGLADLLKGERYSSMDYLWWGALHNENVLRVMASYDIGCQWKINLFSRYKAMPRFLRHDEKGLPDIEVSLPVWHGRGHLNGCEPAETLRHKSGAGMTDGEGVERVWAVSNQKAYATREMQADTRHAALEDHFDRHNWEMNIRLSILLPKKLSIAIEERDKQTKSFKLVSDGVSLNVRNAWLEDIRIWHAREKVPRKDKGVPNPYESPWLDEDLSEKDIRLEMEQMEKQERESLAADVGTKRITTSTMFVKAILGIQATQLRIKSMLLAKGQAARGRDKKVEDARKSISNRLPHVRRLQARFMPLTAELLEREEANAAAEAARSGNTRAPPLEEDIKLWIPSEIPHSSRLSYPTNVFIAEAGIRRLDCGEDLDVVRHQLYTRGHLFAFRDKNVTGQSQNTRSRTLLDDVSDRLDAAVLRYNVSHHALVSLTDEKAALPYRKLTIDDLTTKFMIDYKNKEANRLTKVITSRTRKRVRHAPVQEDHATLDNDENVPSESRRVLSWIWTARGAPDAEEDSFLYDAIRTEWCKAYARKLRWTEEVTLLKEEQRRAVESLRAERNCWIQRKETSSEGKAAYARRQIYARDLLIARFVEAFEPKNANVGVKRRWNAAG